MVRFAIRGEIDGVQIEILDNEVGTQKVDSQLERNGRVSDLPSHCYHMYNMNVFV